MAGQVLYDREMLTTVLVGHQRQSAQFCLCGWGELGKSHAEHVADVYERAAVAGLATERDEAREALRTLFFAVTDDMKPGAGDEPRRRLITVLCDTQKMIVERPRAST